jgi:hypothetical protein
MLTWASTVVRIDSNVSEGDVTRAVEYVPVRCGMTLSLIILLGGNLPLSEVHG